MNHQQRTDFAAIYFNAREDVFLVFAEAKQETGARGEVGEPVRINNAELESRIGDVLLRCLDSFRTNVYSPAKARRYSDEEYRRFRKLHLGVSVRRPPSGDIFIGPLHHSKGGYSGGHGEDIIVSKRDVPGKLASALREAFSLAT